MSNLTPEQIGWEALMDANIISAVYQMFDKSFGGMGLVVVILFIVYQIMLYTKTQNLTLMFITGAFFASLYISSQYVEPFAAQIILIMLVLQLAGIFIVAFFMDRH